MRSFSVTSANIAINDISLKTRFFVPPLIEAISQQAKDVLTAAEASSVRFESGGAVRNSRREFQTMTGEGNAGFYVPGRALLVVSQRSAGHAVFFSLKA